MKKELMPIEITCKCNNCKDGYMIATGKSGISTINIRNVDIINERKLEHKCNKCDNIQHLSEIFPKIIYKRSV